MMTGRCDSMASNHCGTCSIEKPEIESDETEFRDSGARCADRMAGDWRSRRPEKDGAPQGLAGRYESSPTLLCLWAGLPSAALSQSGLGRLLDRWGLRRFGP